MTEKTEIRKAANTPLFKIFDEDERLVKGVVLEPGTIDLQGDIITSENIRKVAFDYMARSRVVGFRHKEATNAAIVESYIADFDFILNDQKVVKGSWVMTVKVFSDDIWLMVKNGEINSFSIGGWGNRTEIPEGQLNAGGD